MSLNLPDRMQSESKPVRLLYAVSAVAVAAPSALAVIPGVPGWIAAAVGAFGLLLTVGLGRYTQDQVTPWKDVAAKVTPSGNIVAGPASDITNGRSVEVVSNPSPPTPEPDLPTPYGG